MKTIIISVTVLFWCGTLRAADPQMHQTKSSKQIDPATVTMYHIPFASTGNKIELTIANSQPQMVANIQVGISKLPNWLHISPGDQTVQSLKGQGEHTATFTFSVDRSAPVKKETTISLDATGTNGQKWTKNINIIVDVPKQFELMQNFPNPFNPTTTIWYDLPHDAKVTLKVYNTLGQEVKTLVDEQQEAGGQSVKVDASMLSSGVYFYRLQAGNFSSVKKDGGGEMKNYRYGF